jgi:hypothetical protein
MFRRFPARMGALLRRVFGSDAVVRKKLLRDDACVFAADTRSTTI